MRLPKGLSIVNYTDKNLNTATIAKLYNTNIVLLDLDGTIRLDNGGWLTMHTKKCMNLVLDKLNIPLQIYQRKGAWYVKNTESNEVREYENNKILTLNA